MVATTELTCEKHHTPTQLACAQCGRPACPRCLVWTEVGQKCRTCVPGRAAAKRGPWVPVGVAVGVLLAVVVGAKAFGGGSSAPDVPKSANQGTTQPGIGQPARDGALTFVVTRFDCGSKDIGDGPTKRTALGRYCVLEIKATNTGAQPTSFLVFTQMLLDAQRRRFAPDPGATVAYQRVGRPGSAPITGEQMNPGAELTTSLVYDVPEGVTPVVAELHAGRTLGVSVRLTGTAGQTIG